MALKIGQQLKAYYNTGTNASPTWVEVKQIGDVSIPDLGITLAEVNIRETDWILNLPAKFNVAIEFPLMFNRGATVHDQIRTDFFAKTARQWAFVDATIATSGTQGIKLFTVIESFPWTQSMEEVSRYDTVRLAPSYTEESSALVEPAWLTIS